MSEQVLAGLEAELGELRAELAGSQGRCSTALLSLVSLSLIPGSCCSRDSAFVSPKRPRVTHETEPFSADLLPLCLWPACSSPEISLQKRDFCVLVKFMSGFETPGINSDLGLVLVPEEKSSFSIVYSSFLYRSKF